jgi:hypothetical protein
VEEKSLELATTAQCLFCIALELEGYRKPVLDPSKR